MTEIALNQLRSKFTTLLGDYRNERPTVEIEELVGPNQAFFVGACGIVIIALPEERILNMSEALREMLNLKKIPDRYNSLCSLTHPDYKEACRNHFLYSLKLFEKIDDPRSFKIKSGHCIRMRNGVGSFITFYRQFFPLAYDANNKLSHLLIVYTDVSHIESGLNSNLSIIGLNGKSDYKKNRRKEGEPAIADLSRRELQVLRLVADNHSSHKIAEMLFLSPHTIKIHRKNLLRKTGTSSSLELVMLAKDKGWI